MAAFGAPIEKVDELKIRLFSCTYVFKSHHFEQKTVVKLNGLLSYKCKRLKKYINNSRERGQTYPQAPGWERTKMRLATRRAC